jgi:hypothetical protein
MDAFLPFMEENNNETLDQADGLECFCNEDTAGSNEDDDGSNEDAVTLILGLSWLNQQDLMLLFYKMWRMKDSLCSSAKAMTHHSLSGLRMKSPIFTRRDLSQLE